MAFFKLLLLPHIPIPRRQSPHLLTSIHHLSVSSSPESSSTSRRRHRHLLGIPPPSLSNIPSPSPPLKSQPIPSIPKLPNPLLTPLSSTPLLTLHNTILTLLRSGDLHESNLLIRHSVYSNSRPAIHTVNAVLSALLSHSRHTDLLSLHRFVSQAGIPPTVATHNLLIQSYIDSRNLDVALSYYTFISQQLPLLPSPSTYRILVTALVAASRLEEAVRIKDEMVALIEPDLVVYDILMTGLVDGGDPDRALVLFQELREKVGDSVVKDCGRIVYGSLMKAYFKKGMKEEALELYNSVLGEKEVGSGFWFDPRCYNSMLEALCGNGGFEEALSLFEKMVAGHCPPMRLSVDLESFNLMVDGYCASGRFEEALDVFGKIEEKKIVVDTMAYNNLIKNLGKNGMVVKAEELYREMSVHGIKPDEQTFAFLMEACFVVDRMEDATRYLSEMADLGIEPGTLAYNTVLGGLVKKGELADAMGFFDRMIEKEVKRDVVSYEVLLKAFCDSDRLDHHVLKVVVRALLMDKNVVYTQDMKEILEAAARRGGMEVELVKLYDEVEKEKEDEVIREAEEKARLDGLAREERLEKRAEAKAKQAATTRITKEHIEMHIKRFSLGNIGGEKQDLPSLGEAFWKGGGLLKQISDNNSSLTEVLKVGTKAEEMEGVDGMGFKSTANV